MKAVLAGKKRYQLVKNKQVTCGRMAETTGMQVENIRDWVGRSVFLGEVFLWQKMVYPFCEGMGRFGGTGKGFLCSISLRWVVGSGVKWIIWGGLKSEGDLCVWWKGGRKREEGKGGKEERMKHDEEEERWRREKGEEEWKREVKRMEEGERGEEEEKEEEMIIKRKQSS